MVLGHIHPAGIKCISALGRMCPCRRILGVTVVFGTTKNNVLSILKVSYMIITLYIQWQSHILHRVAAMHPIAHTHKALASLNARPWRVTFVYQF